MTCSSMEYFTYSGYRISSAFVWSTNGSTPLLTTLPSGNAFCGGWTFRSLLFPRLHDVRSRNLAASKRSGCLSALSRCPGTSHPETPLHTGHDRSKLSTTFNPWSSSPEALTSLHLSEKKLAIPLPSWFLFSTTEKAELYLWRRPTHRRRRIIFKRNT